MDESRRMILVAGGSGYVGGQLIPQLGARPQPVRCLARDPDAMRPHLRTAEIVAGDVLDPTSLERALVGVDTAYYLVHLMSDSNDFEQKDREAASHFATAARAQGVRRIIYLGGLGDDTDPKLSPHLRSRHEVGEIFRKSGVETIEFRASMIVGSGSLSYGLLKDLTNRLPVMLCPHWLSTPTQPIFVDDLVAYLVAALDLPHQGHQTFEVGGPDVITFKGLIREYARLRGQTRWLIDVPVLTPWLSGLWLTLVTPSHARVGRHLIEGLVNPTVVRDPSARATFAITPVGIAEAVGRVIRQEDQEATQDKTEPSLAR